MAYIRPSASAADATWQGASAYTRPAAGVADATWDASGGLPAAGFISTSFGVAISGRAQQASGTPPGIFGTPLAPYAATGFYGTSFGTPLGVFDQTQSAAGFSTTDVGAASTPLPASGFAGTQFGATTAAFWQILGASGFLATRHGDPSGQQHWSADSVGAVARFSKAFYAFAQTQLSSGRSGTTFGQPMAFRVSPPNIAQLTQAFGFPSSAVGMPSSGWLQTAGATGFSGTYFGAASSTMAQRAHGIAGAVFGVAATGISVYPHGFGVVVVGASTLRITQPHSSTYRPARFGTAKAARSNTFIAYGTNRSGRIGHPKGFTRFNYQASGLNGTAIGTPACREAHRAPHMPPGTAFGRPLLRRSTVC